MRELALSPTLLERDRGLVWHPYSALPADPVYEVTGAHGVRLQLAGPDQTRYEVIDGMSSWWSAIHGYRHPALDAALTAQAECYSHVMFGGLTHEPAVHLAEQLVELTPGPLRHVFFADSGSVAVEVALKLALQVQVASGRPARRRFVALRGGYHGDTAGAMSVSDPLDGTRAVFDGHVAAHLFLARPPAAQLVDGRLVSDGAAVAAWIEHAGCVLARHGDEIAGIIVEPVLQGAGGMFVYAPECLLALRGIADRHGILLIFDEIATGFGRTGRVFASEWAGVAPDILCIGKALTGGYLTLAAMLCSTAVARALRGTTQQVLMHGPTFMANPLACAVATASIDVLRNAWQPLVSTIETALGAVLPAATALGAVRSVRVFGAVGVIELDQPVDTAAVTAVALRRGVWLRPFRNLVYAMPPYTCTADDAETVARAMVAAVAEVHG